jgi:hypothetical protein
MLSTLEEGVLEHQLASLSVSITVTKLLISESLKTELKEMMRVKSYRVASVRLEYVKLDVPGQ